MNNMSKPKTLHDLLIGQHIGLREVEDIARTVFDGKTTMAGPEGYLVTACRYDDLPKHIRQYVRKAFFYFTIENVLDVNVGDNYEVTSLLADLVHDDNNGKKTGKA